MIKPWLFEFFPELGDEARDPEPGDVADYVARYLDLWTRDEALGFEGIFFSEHHFGGSFSASPKLVRDGVRIAAGDRGRRRRRR